MKTNENRLKERLLSGDEDVWVMNQEKKIENRSFKAVVFDFDGVLLRECEKSNLPERGYGWLLRALREGNYDPTDITVSQEDISSAKAFRPNIKGKSMTEKVEAFHSEFGRGDLKIPVEKLVRLWFDALKYNVLDHFGDDPDGYRMPGARRLLETASSRYPLFGVTANEFQHAHFLMKFVRFKDYFVEIVGYPIHAFPKTSKATLLADLLFRHNIKPSDACYIGDGVSDIKAGKRAGTATLGIANATLPVSFIGDAAYRDKIIEKSTQNGMKLIDQGCDYLATSLMAHKSIIEYLGLDSVK